MLELRIQYSQKHKKSFEIHKSNNRLSKFLNNSLHNSEDVKNLRLSSEEHSLQIQNGEMFTPYTNTSNYKKTNLAKKKESKRDTTLFPDLNKDLRISTSFAESRRKNASRKL